MNFQTAINIILAVALGNAYYELNEIREIAQHTQNIVYSYDDPGRGAIAVMQDEIANLKSRMVN
jgi:hypothetical protein